MKTKVYILKTIGKYFLCNEQGEISFDFSARKMAEWDTLESVMESVERGGFSLIEVKELNHFRFDGGRVVLNDETS